jgi:ABC transporter substrate binding protein (PQQ-dependent alcohol dehydrogenase system)
MPRGVCWNRALARLFGAVLASGLVAATSAVGAQTADAPVATTPAQPLQLIRIGYLSRAAEDSRPAIYGLPPRLSDEGAQGARLGLDDNASTGRFSGQAFELVETMLQDKEDAGAAVRAFVEGGITFIVADLLAADLDAALTAPEAARALIFNARAPDDRFRNADCRSFLLHTTPSRAMLADALAQYLVRKRWVRWLLVTGKRKNDTLFAEAIRRSARRFGGQIVAEKPWVGSFDGRRTAAEEIPLFTQDVRYDVLVVADEAGIFGDLFPYRTWDPRPVAGTQGLSPAAWHPRLEQWGAAQLQSRFYRKAGRPMTGPDYAAWAAVRSIGEAATRTRATDRDTIAAYVRSGDFELSGFKGRKLSFRMWDGQLRQPIPLGWAEAVVSVSPQEGFLHPSSELDSLGDDAPESGCRNR